MKYSDANKPLQCIMTQSSCYKGTYTFKPKGVLWHCTGANNPNLWRYVQPSDNDPNKAALLAKLGKNNYGTDWNHTAVSAGVNAWIGKAADGEVLAVQTLPWNYAPWGCASGAKGSANNTHIQFEMCEDALTDKAYFEKCYKEGVELTAYLCKLYSIDPMGTTKVGSATVPTILCHNDAYKYGVGSGHGDVYNWFNIYGRTMDDVRRDVAALLNGTTAQAPAQTQTPAASSSPEAFIAKITPYVQELAPKYGIKCVSAVIAQACLESAYGTSAKAQKNNFFGLKYREGRLTVHSGTFTDTSKEQSANGAYQTVSTQWYAFANMRDGVEGYFQFINIANYANLKGVKDPQTYLENIRKDGYATSLTYVENVMNVVKKYELTRFDTDTPAAETVSGKAVPNITYAVKTKSGVIADVKNGIETGKNGEQILGVKIGVDVGEVIYRVHCGGRWLPKVTGNDWKDFNNGYAGDDVNAIDAIQIYYTSDRNKTDVYEAVYAVKPIGNTTFLEDVYDTTWEKGDGVDTAGLFGKPFDRIKIYLRKI